MNGWVVDMGEAPIMESTKSWLDNIRRDVASTCWGYLFYCFYPDCGSHGGVYIPGGPDAVEISFDHAVEKMHEHGWLWVNKLDDWWMCPTCCESFRQAQKDAEAQGTKLQVAHDFGRAV